MLFLIDLIPATLTLLQQVRQPAEPNYLIPVIAALASLAVAGISAVVSIVALFISRGTQRDLQAEQAELTRRNQSELANLQSSLTQQTQTEIEKAKAELTERTQLRLESHKAELTAKNQEGMEFLRAKLGEQGKERDARRDYEYEAHKRLYTECEPLLFQLADLAEHAYHRVHSLARTARLGLLPDWLDGDGYFLRSTMYRLLAPLVIFRLIQQRLTFVDLTLDAYIANQYRLLKLLYRTFTDAFDFAAIEPRIEYDPDVDDWQNKREEDQQKYWRQGLFLGSLDNAIDALLVTRNDQAAQWKTYGQFEDEHRDKNSDTHRRLATLADILDRFHPRSRPVLWRVFWAQTLIHKQILENQTAAGGLTSRVGLASVSPNLPARGLDWRTSESEASADEALLIPQKVAQEYLRTRLPQVFGKSPSP